MASTEPKKRSITGNLVANLLTEREDDFTFNVTYVSNRSIDDLCKLAANNKSKFTASELRSAYDELLAQAEEELYSASTVEFGFSNNSLGVDGSFIGPEAKFDRTKNKVNIRCTPRTEFRKKLDEISVIVGHVVEGMPVIIKVTDVFTGEVNTKLSPNNTLNGEGKRTKIVGTEGNTVGFFLINSTDETSTSVPVTSVSRNDPSYFSFIIPQLPEGTYYLEIATQYGGNNQTVLKEVRRNRFPYLLTVGNSNERPDEV